MAGKLNNRGPQDASRINLNEEWARKYWTKEFGVTEDQLKSAVQQVGVNVESVARHLQK